MQEAVGQIFVSFDTCESSERAKKAVAGRSFNGKTVLACFYPEDLYNKKMYVLPSNGNGSTGINGKSKSGNSDDPDSYFNDPDMD